MNPFKRYQHTAHEWIERYKETESTIVRLIQMQAFTWPIWVLLAVPDYQTLPPEFTLLILVFAVGNFPFAILSSFLFGVNVWNRLKEEWKRHSNHTEQTKLRDYQQP